ncbi:MAG TPA: winged helix-turn-helix domain-containing protein [Candidatus Nanoarchaeia archaeon]|nr:winged helix-turn-helix domain-containing protein [Candidatus Nanoarchaeia archaeon]
MNKSRIEINLEDFPDDIYILLEDNFRAEFFKTAWKINKSYRHLAKKLGVSNPVMLSWRRGMINFTKQDQFCPVWAIKSIIDYSKHSGKFNYNLEKVQENIKSIRCRAGNYKIYNVKLPIRDSRELRSLVTHLICDGSALNEKHRTSKYASTSLETVNEVKEKLSIFGNTPNLLIRKETYTNHYLPSYVLNFSKAITKILTKKFNIDFRGDKARFPKEFLKGKRKFLVAIVRAFLIDEGCINDRTIIFCSGSMKLLEDLKQICEMLEYKCQNIRKNGGTYYLNISPDSFTKVYKDLTLFGNLPISEKQKRLDLGLKIINNSPNFRNLDNKILALLKEPKSTLDISRELLVNSKTINERLKKLQKLGLAERNPVRNLGKGGPFNWKIRHHP